MFTSDKITSIDLSAVGHFSAVFDDDEASILNLCASLEVEAVKVYNCPGFEFLYFAQQGDIGLRRLKHFMGNAAYYPIIGYYSDSPPIDAAGTHYSIFEHEMRAVYMRWRIGVEQADLAHHINARHVMVFLKKWHERARPRSAIGLNGPSARTPL